MIHVLTLCYAPVRILNAGVSRLYESYGNAPFRHYLINQHYPLRPQEVSEDIEKLRARYQCSVLDPGKNLGLHDGLNWACGQIGPKIGDIIVLYDPDSYPLEFGWLSAISLAIDTMDFAVVGLTDPRAAQEVPQATRALYRREGDNLEVAEVSRPCVISVAGYRWEFISQAGGFQEPNRYYGGLEAAMWAHLNGRRWGYLTRFKEDFRLRDDQDEELKQYKWAHAHLKTFPGSFEEYLQSGQKTEAPKVLP